MVATEARKIASEQIWNSLPRIIRQNIENAVNSGELKCEMIFKEDFVGQFNECTEYFHLLKELGYSQEEVIETTVSFPEIFGLSVETIREKIKFYDSINLRGTMIKFPKKLMQSVRLSYARYMFFVKEHNIVVSDDDYTGLFMAQVYFERKYGINKSSRKI